jgi:hypothetical protein
MMMGMRVKVMCVTAASMAGVALLQPVRADGTFSAILQAICGPADRMEIVQGQTTLAKRFAPLSCARLSRRRATRVRHRRPQCRAHLHGRAVWRVKQAGVDCEGSRYGILDYTDAQVLVRRLVTLSMSRSLRAIPSGA